MKGMRSVINIVFGFVITIMVLQQIWLSRFIDRPRKIISRADLQQNIDTRERPALPDPFHQKGHQAEKELDYTNTSLKGNHSGTILKSKTYKGSAVEKRVLTEWSNVTERTAKKMDVGITTNTAEGNSSEKRLPAKGNTDVTATREKASSTIRTDEIASPLFDFEEYVAERQERNALFREKYAHMWNSPDCTYIPNVLDGFTVESKPERFIYADGPGRLGNKMFQYASAIGIARRNGYTPLIQTRGYLSDMFQVTHITENHPNISVYLSEEASARYDRCLEQVPNVTSYILYGFYQSWKYFSNAEAEVRKEFRFKENIMKKVRAFFRGSKLVNKTTIGVHVRKGDMTLPYSIKRGYTTATPGYFRKAMNYFRKKYSNVVFVVCSDDMRWAMKNVVGDDVVYHNKEVGIDLAILAHCQHSIMSTGSFGWWAAWLAGGETIYYSDYPARNSKLSKTFSKEDYFPPNWIGM